MARCSDATCSCVVRGGVGVSVAGAGTPQSPYVVQVDQSGRLAVVDTPTIDLSLIGQGTADDPGLLSATLIAHLGDLVDVAKGVPPTGQVLAWTGAQWAPVPPTTAAAGSVAVGPGLTGDGSTGAPLRPVVDPNAGLAVGTLGLGLSTATQTRITNLETKRFDPQYLRAERSDSMTCVNATWTRPLSMNLGATRVVGTRLSYGSGYITALDAGVYAWEATCVWAGLPAQTSLPAIACTAQVNDSIRKYGAQTLYQPADDTLGSVRFSYTGTLSLNANDKVSVAYDQNNPSKASRAVTPEAFALYRVA